MDMNNEAHPINPMLALLMAGAYERDARKAARQVESEKRAAAHRCAAIDGGGARERERRMRRLLPKSGEIINAD